MLNYQRVHSLGAEGLCLDVTSILYFWWFAKNQSVLKYDKYILYVCINVYAKSIFTLESIYHTWGQPQNLRSNWHLALAKSSSHFPRLNWLVGWNMNFIFPYIGKNHPNWLSYFSEGLKPSTSSMFHNMRPLRVHVPIDLSRTPFGWLRKKIVHRAYAGHWGCPCGMTQLFGFVWNRDHVPSCSILTPPKNTHANFEA